MRNFGIFELVVKKSRIGRDPNRPEKDVIIPERVAVKLKMGKLMSTKVKKLKAADIKQ